MIHIIWQLSMICFLYLAVVIDVGEVSVIATLAGEADIERLLEEQVGVHGEEEGLVGGLTFLGKG